MWINVNIMLTEDLDRHSVLTGITRKKCVFLRIAKAGCFHRRILKNPKGGRRVGK